LYNGTKIKFIEGPAGMPPPKHNDVTLTGYNNYNFHFIEYDSPFRPVCPECTNSDFYACYPDYYTHCYNYNVSFFPFSQDYHDSELFPLDEGNYTFKITDHCGDSTTVTIPYHKKKLTTEDIKWSITPNVGCDGGDPLSEIHISGNVSDDGSSMIPVFKLVSAPGSIADADVAVNCDRATEQPSRIVGQRDAASGAIADADAIANKDRAAVLAGTVASKRNCATRSIADASVAENANRATAEISGRVVGEREIAAGSTADNDVAASTDCAAITIGRVVTHGNGAGGATADADSAPDAGIEGAGEDCSAASSGSVIVGNQRSCDGHVAEWRENSAAISAGAIAAQRGCACIVADRHVSGDPDRATEDPGRIVGQ
jgi:hypothetical protein